MKSFKSKVLVLATFLVAVLLISGTSYAYLKAERTSTNDQKLTLSDFGVVLLTDITNVTLNNTYPMSDLEGLRNDKVTFQIKNTGEVVANYKISLVDSSTTNTLLNNEIRYRLTRTNESTSEKITYDIKTVEDSGLITTDSIEPNITYTFSLICWVNRNSTRANGVFSKKILVEGMQASNLDKSGANYPELLDNMIPVYYNNGWKKADSKNLNSTYKWFDYNDKMWANAVTIRKGNLMYNQLTNAQVATSSSYTLNDEGIYFDGVDDYMNLGLANYDFNNTVTMVTRFKVHSVDSTTTHNVFSNIENYGAYLTITEDGQLYFGINALTETYHGKRSPLYELELNRWYTAVGTYNGSKIRLYIDGEEIEDGTDFTDYLLPASYDCAFTLGANPGRNNASYDRFGNITISHAYLYDSTLNEDAIKRYFSGNITSYPEDNLLIAIGATPKINYYKNLTLGSDIANADISSMWTWIPRYKYVVFNTENTLVSTGDKVDVVFEHGVDSTGTISCSSNASSTETCTDSTNNNLIDEKSTYTHPAFTFDSKELTGFWMGKYSMSTNDSGCLTNNTAEYCDKTGLDILVSPGSTSLKNISLNNLYENVKNMTNNDNINSFSKTSSVTPYLNDFDIHLQKNMEYGATAILGDSKYGNYGTLSENLISTTSNNYGVIYSSLENEYVMANKLNSGNNFNPGSANFTPNEKYYDKYPYSGAFGKLGDINREYDYSGSYTNPDASNPWISINVQDNGVYLPYYTVNKLTGAADASTTSRPTIAIFRQLPWLNH